MDDRELIHKIGLRNYVELIEKVNAQAQPMNPRHVHSTYEEREQCPECHEWDRVWEANFEREISELTIWYEDFHRRGETN